MQIMPYEDISTTMKYYVGNRSFPLWDHSAKIA